MRLPRLALASVALAVPVVLGTTVVPLHAQSQAADPPKAEARPAVRPLSDSDVSAMIKAGLAADVVIAKIKSSPCSFDTSPGALEKLKAAQVPDPVILTMVAAPDAAASSADPGPCVLLKRMGPADQVTSHLYSFGFRGKQFLYLEGDLPKGVKFHGRLTDHDVREIESHGGRVTVLDNHYTPQELNDARKSCSQSAER